MPGLLAAVLFSAPLAEAAPPVGVVSHVQVLSDKVEDVSSLEAWKKSFIKEGMSDEQKAMAVWRSVAEFQFQDIPPHEYLQTESLVLDPIKTMNVYGYSFCSVASAGVECLARYAGLQARGWTINGHVVSEIYFNDAWHLLDSSLITYFPKAEGGPAGVEEIAAGIKDWNGQHPELADNSDKLNAFMRNGGWKNGPAVLARCPWYDDNGWLPAATHGWYSTMIEYDGKTLNHYEAGYSQGYRVNVQLREGERLVRNWSHQGLHVDADLGATPGVLQETVGKGGLRYSPKFGDLAPARLGNGTLTYDVPLASGAFRGGALVAENLAATAEDRQAPALHLANAAQPGTLVLRMPSSYVYLDGELSARAAIPAGGSVEVLFSGNNGLDWKPLAQWSASGAQQVDLKPLVLRRYDYQLKFLLHGRGTGLEALQIAHRIQHSQRPLPALDTGDNKISFGADAEGTVTIEGSMEAGNAGRQLLYTDFHPELKNITPDLARLSAGTGEITFPIETPSEMKRLRIGTFYRARDPQDGWEVQVSFDGGKSFRTVDRLPGPFVGMGKYTVVADVPAGARAAQVRFAGTQRSTTMLYNVRIDADYTEPHGGFHPVKITYAWEEDGAPKQDIHVARRPGDTYTIACAAKPLMKSLTVELAP